MTKRLRQFAAGVLLALAAVSTALAGQPVSLRADVSSGRTVTLGDLFDNAGSAEQVMVGYGAPAGQNAVLDAGEVQRIARLHGLDWANPEGIRRIVVRSDARVSLEAGPAAPKMIEALTYTRNLAAGEIVQPTDLAYGKTPSFSAPGDMPRDAEVIIGKVVRRPLRAGAVVALHDVTTAQVIKRDDMVQVAYRADGVTLIMQGKALAGAAMGEPVTVMNTLSKKAIQAVASGPDEAVVGPEAQQLRAGAASSAQFAALQ